MRISQVASGYAPVHRFAQPSPNRTGQGVGLKPLHGGLGVSLGVKNPERLNFTELLDKASVALYENLHRLFTENGIDTSRKIELDTDGSGKVIVTHDHPDAAKIEELLQERDDLSNRFRGVSGLASLVRASERAYKFKEEYILDPEAAVLKYRDLFTHTWDFSFAMGDNGFEMRYAKRMRA